MEINPIKTKADYRAALVPWLELMDRDLSKAERMQRLRELAKSGDDVPDELMDQALRKLMERLTE